MTRRRTQALVWIAWAIVLGVFLKNAWVSEDAYISFRSVEQLFAGHGPRWNPHERVQAFTSPLWFLLLAGARVFTRNLFLASLLLSAGCLSALLVLMQRLVRSPLHFAVACALLVSSRAFFDFTSSGLEHPLAYVLIALGVGLYARAVSGGAGGAGSSREATAFFVLLGLAALCRHDLWTLLLPPAAYLWWTRRGQGWRRGLAWAAIALAPLIVWSAFSVFYYGFPFPNTAYAKLNVGIPPFELAQRGLQYLVMVAQQDPLTIAVLGAALMRLGLSGNPPLRWLAAGMVMNTAYVVGVGGDFMLGRFIAFSFLTAVLALGHWGLGFEWRLLGVEARFRVEQPGRFAWALAAMLVAYALVNVRAPARTSLDYYDDRLLGDVADERGFYFRTNSLWQYLQWLRRGDAARPPCFPFHIFALAGYRLRESGAACQVNWNVGMGGYFAGLDAIIVDPFALTDPLLARLPAVRGSRVGHYARRIPEGYVRTACGGPAAIKDARLHAFHERLSLVTQGPLLAPGRLRTILAMNLGLYDVYLRDAWQDPDAAPTPRVIAPSSAGVRTLALPGPHSTPARPGTE